MSKNKKVILAYSGGLDTSVILKWLVLKGYHVIAVTVNVGQKQDFAATEKKAYASGAEKFIVKDATNAFVEKGLFQCLKAQAKYEGLYLMGTAIARPFITEKLVEAAIEEGTHLIAHGSTGKGNDQCRFELCAYALLPGAKIIAPWRDPEFFNTIIGRPEAMEFAKKHGIPIDATPSEPWSIDDNIAHISSESGVLEDPAKPPPETVTKWVTDPKKAPDHPETVLIEFEKGVPVAVNGAALSPVDLLHLLNALGAKHGVGVLDFVENRFVGMKSRGVYEAPGMSILYQAHQVLEGLALEKETLHLRDTLIPKYAQLVYNGYWYSPALKALNAFVDAAQETVTGTVEMELYKGNMKILSRTSPNSLYDQTLVSMDELEGFNPQDAGGFLKITGLPFKLQAAKEAASHAPHVELQKT